MQSAMDGSRWTLREDVWAMLDNLDAWKPFFQPYSRWNLPQKVTGRVMWNTDLDLGAQLFHTPTLEDLEIDR